MTSFVPPQRIDKGIATGNRSRDPNRFRFSLKGYLAFLKKFGLGNVMILAQALLIAGFVALLLGGSAGRSAGHFFGFVIAYFVVATGNLFQRDHQWTRQSTSSETQPEWKVSINDVVVGTLSDKEYGEIGSEVLLDARVHARQTRTIYRFMIRLVDRILLTAPLVAFWIAVAWVITDPDGFRTTFHNIADLTHTQALGLVALVRVVVQIALLGYGVIAVFTAPWADATTAFEDEMSTRIRVRMNCTSPGKVTMQRPNTAIAPDVVAGATSGL